MYYLEFNIYFKVEIIKLNAYTKIHLICLLNSSITYMSSTIRAILNFS